MKNSYESQPKGWNFLWEYGICMFKMKSLRLVGILCVLMVLVISITMKEQHAHTEMDQKSHPFDSMKDLETSFKDSHEGFPRKKDSLPQGIVQATSNMELKPLWMMKSLKVKGYNQKHRNLLAIPVSIRQKENVDSIVQKFLSENFMILLFHYDGIIDEWHDLEWSQKAIHISARNHTTWGFAKRFLHPDVISTYDYIFIWDKDLIADNFHPGRYLKIMKSKGLEISQPTLDPSTSKFHDQRTIQIMPGMVHRWVEGIALVFSRAAWHCAWHGIQNDLAHGQIRDKIFGHCAQKIS
ncbi:hypothetical protein AMTRI_Chr02g219080 [Amborella trichopoda]|uniref:uncharacterized protein LOC18431562 n=1 Tax=Amborella trichopoda TaxID=13333 RepID=UPI0009BFA64A|nr:uncharacterized protein LOC18431562 [Amborella trichopoda]XP_020521223.1 uncharacterized protein LOC18431562 [Amborella trichopoda]XP_020521224.1 uncharacterized protein LOC18431562 [Amborella trichopoda]XP_020521226.1 uncharacterized protein LOC18431562 [Amborella trichopoda]XP_020521227.1 uncharacterized protein LOC18431562 [Amborella trichopoda]XP_020521228.1 uncharacterized protein LOC18431562 [Amborella trichopoda]XP_020521229.1 uncharacterized protein LOC18431562 [Amborella trichopod|eukprot:XP_020521222.1 uncharacterized protein LOC18431562 [Amborella trichopoda]